MKKIYSLIAAVMISAASFAQYSLTLQLDVNDYVAAGNTINATGVHVAGAFATNGCAEILADWSPADVGGALVDMGGGIWEISLTFTAAVDDSLQFKFINGNDWAVGAPNIEGQSGTTLLSEACGFGDGFGGFNRLYVFGADLDQAYQFCWDMCTKCDGSDPLLVGIFDFDQISNDITVYPNPASTAAVINFSLTTPGEVSFEIYNVTGQLVKSFNSNYAFSGNSSYTMDLSGLDKGMYNLIMRSNDSVATKGIVKN